MEMAQEALQRGFGLWAIGGLLALCRALCVAELAAAGIIVAVTLPNLLGHRQSAWTQNLTTILKLGLYFVRDGLPEPVPV